MGRLLEGHIAVVTGAASGIGRAIAKGYAAEGARVMAADINEDGARETAAMITEAGGTAVSGALDVTNRASCAALAETVERQFGAASVLVNNAGIVRRETISATNADADWDAVMAVNATGVYNVTKAFLEALKQTQGRIVNIGSIQSQVHTGNAAVYTVAKHGVLGLTRALAAELGPDGIRVRHRARSDPHAAQRRDSGESGYCGAVPTPHAARPCRRARRHCRPSDLPGVRPVGFCDGGADRRGWRVSDALTLAEGDIRHQPASSASS